MVQELGDALHRLAHLSAPDAAAEPSTAAHKKDAKYYEMQIETAHSFLSVYPHVLKLLFEGEARRDAALLRLRQEREAWGKVYANVADLAVRQLGRKVTAAEQAVERTTLALESMQVPMHAIFPTLNCHAQHSHQAAAQ